MSPVKSQRGVVAAGHEETVRSAELLLREGGNAFDAILGGMCAACVVEPVLASFGGGGFLLGYGPGCRDSIFDFFVQTPRKRRPAGDLDFRPVDVDFGEVQQQFHCGLGSVATPGVVRGLFEIHRELGSMPLAEVVAPAVELARKGAVVNAFQAYALKIVQPIFLATPEARRLYESERVAGQPLTGGELLRLPELADLLEVLAIEGEDLFYRGEVAQRIAESSEGAGGTLSLDDLGAYRVERREPLTVGYRGVQIMTNPPPASGGLLIALALKLLEAEPEFGKLGFGTAGHLDLLARAMERADVVRDDAARNGMPIDRSLLDPELLGRYGEEVRDRARAFRGTTHLNVIDARGNVAALTLSNGAGSGWVVPGTGVMLNNMLGEDDLSPLGFHRWPLDQRMTSMMSPTLVHWPDGRITATGSGGSKRIRGAVLQVLTHLIDCGMGIEEAVAAPRVFFEDDLLSVEQGLESRELERLFEGYPRHREWGELNLFFGGAHTVELDGDELRGAGDPRRGGVCRVIR